MNDHKNIFYNIFFAGKQNLQKRTLGVTYLGLYFIVAINLYLIHGGIRFESILEFTCRNYTSFLLRNSGCHNEIFSSIAWYRCLWKERPNGMRNYLHSILVVSMAAGMAASWNSGNNGLLFTERMFGWELVDYTNFTSFAFVIIALR